MVQVIDQKANAARRTEWRRGLASVALLRGLNDRDLEALAGRCRWRRVKAGTRILERNAESRDVYFVIEGRVRISRHGEGGRAISLEDIGPGGWFGEFAALDGLHRSAEVVAVVDTRLASLQAQPFRDLLAEHPSVALALMRHLVGLVRSANRRIVALSTEAAQVRVVGELLRLADRTGEARAARIEALPSHADIAARAGTSRETVARTISDLTKRGLLQRQEQALAIPDIEALVGGVRGDPDESTENNEL